MFNVNRDPRKGKPAQPADFMPARTSRKKTPPLQTDITALKMFLKGTP